MRIRPVETSGLPIPFQRRGQGPVIVGSPDPLAWANKADGAKHAWDFIANAARWNGQYIGALANTPNWTFTRASTGYAQTAAGVLVPFASGELRRTDKGVLIEGAGTNLCLQSQTFDSATWSKTNASVSANAAAAPDGTTTADTVIPNTSSGVTHYVSQAVTLTAVSHTISVYLKPSGYSKFGVREATTSGAYATFNLSGFGSVIEVGSSTATITALANGWYRVTMTLTASAGAKTLTFNVMDASYASGSPHLYNYAGDGTSGIHYWGAQLEATAHAPSYVPTTTASETRAADSLTVTGVTGLDYPLTLYAEFEIALPSGASLTGLQNGVLEVDTGGIANASAIYTSSSAYVALNRIATVNNAVVSGGAAVAGTPRKLAGSFATNDARGAYNGTLFATPDTSLTVSTPSRISFGAQLVGNSLCYLRRAAIFSRALTNAELQALTT